MVRCCSVNSTTPRSARFSPDACSCPLSCALACSCPLSCTLYCPGPTRLVSLYLYAGICLPLSLTLLHLLPAFILSRDSNVSLPLSAFAFRLFRLSSCSLTQSDIWFLRFGLDPSLQFMVVGNMIGNLLIFDLASMPNTRETAKLSHSQCTGIVRQTGLSLPLSPSLSLSLAPCPSSSASPAPLHAALPDPHPPPSHQSLISFCSPPPLRPLPYPLARYNPRLPSSQSPTPWQPLSRSTHMPDVSVPN